MRFLLWALALVTLAGCAGDNEIDAASLEFEGTGSGNHSDTAECDDDATLAGTGNIDDGTVHVMVTDGSGATKFDKEFSAGVDTEGESMEGASGDWEITVTRAGDDLVGDEFNGQYVFTLTC